LLINVILKNFNFVKHEQELLDSVLDFVKRDKTLSCVPSYLYTTIFTDDIYFELPSVLLNYYI